MAADCDSQSAWLQSYFQSLPHELDIDVISEYILAIVKEADASESALYTEIEGLLSAYLPDDVCKQSSSEIVRHFHHLVQHRDPNTLASANPNSADPSASGIDSEVVLLKMEEQMRALVKADYEKQIKAAETRAVDQRCVRDACTKAVLRDAGVAGYQGNSEDEKDVEIAITNAAFEAKQMLDSGGSVDATGVAVTSEENVPLGSTEDGIESGLDLQDLEDRSGYGAKDGAKPGTVEDALSVLNPSLFGSSVNKQPFPPGVTRLPTPGSRPTGFRLTGGALPTPVVASSRVEISRPALEEPAASGSQRKKKQPAPSRHIAKVGALAEAKSKTESRRGATAVRAREEEMASFLFSDSDDGDNKPAPMPEGGKNRERVVASERAARDAAAADCAQRRSEEKANREEQLAQQAKRKQAAQQKAQKVQDRRR